jgi:hypothetical protein
MARVAMSVVRLLLPKARLLAWHKSLVETLRRDGHVVGVELSDRAVEIRPALALLEYGERRVFQRGQPSLTDRVEAGAWAEGEAAPPDFLFDLSGADDAASGAIAPAYDGLIGDAARDAALLDGRAPRLALVADGHVLAQGFPAIEQSPRLLRGRIAVAQRIQTLILGLTGGSPTLFATPTAASAARNGHPIGYLASTVITLARRKLSKLVAHEGHWRIGWRALAGGPSTMEALAWPSGNPWRWLPDDRRRYFADPFLFAHGGKTYVFCEEYPYATQKGVISVFTLDPEGRASATRTVLERPYHLSYPFVFEQDGQIWMMPESSANRSLELYRAESFPDRWVLDRTLLSDVTISDATIFERDGRWWLMGTTQEPETSSWDCLSLFSGPSIVGPWTPSGDTPILIDASSARPAGHVVTRGGVAWRPAQDCADGYGSGLALCRIDALSEGVFEQTVARRLGPPEGATVKGVHTLNAGFGFEVIDAVGPRSRKAWLGEGDAT